MLRRRRPLWGDGVKAIASAVRAMKGNAVNLTEADRHALESLLPMPFELEDASDRGQLMRSDMGRLSSRIGTPMTFAGQEMSAADCKAVFMKFHKPPALTFDDV